MVPRVLAKVPRVLAKEMELPFSDRRKNMEWRGEKGDHS
jgi:hypothetical protein